MKLLTVGDSFTYGDELSDITRAWPYVLQNKLSCDLTNLGKSGEGNTSMVRTVIEHANNYDIIIVAWSHFARIEFADHYGEYTTWPGHRGITFTGDLVHRMELVKYITRYHSDWYLYKQHLLNIILLQSFAKQHNKKLIMLDAMPTEPWATSPKLSSLSSQIDTNYFIGWAKESMMDWTYGYAKGPNGHFLEQGHQVVADKIYEYIRNLSWIS
jgi:hypothetical protein